ncbi:MAG: glucoamylase family protein, partial [Sphingomicrobium sp.]
VPGRGWYDGDYLGIDQGPIVAMIANHRDAMIWKRMRGSKPIVDGLRRAGFAGGWLDRAA